MHQLFAVCCVEPIRLQGQDQEGCSTVALRSVDDDRGANWADRGKSPFLHRQGPGRHTEFLGLDRGQHYRFIDMLPYVMLLSAFIPLPELP